MVDRPARWEARDLHYRELLDTAPDAIVVVAADGAIAFVNLQTEKLFGYTRAELVGQSMEVLIPERLRAGHSHHVARFLSHPVTRPMGSGSLSSAGARTEPTFPSR